MLKLIDIPKELDTIQIRKVAKKLFSEARNAAKPSKCILCGESQTSFCNSHSVPQFSLRSIADNGIILHASALIGIGIMDIEKGVKNSGTFFFICSSCDGKFFQDYENEQNLRLMPSDKMLAEIAVKDFLLLLSKRTQEEELYKELQLHYNMYTNHQYLKEITNLDIRDFNEELQFHKSIVDNNLSGGYQILFWKLLPYKVPIALQSAIALTKDLEGNQINNIYDITNSVQMQFIHLIILPISEASIVLAFYHKRDKLYRKLRHQINCSSEQKVLQYLNYIAFANTENYFMSKSLQSTIESDEKLSLLAKENNGNPDLGLLGLNNNFGIGYQPVKMDEIPNFLSFEWAIT